MAIWMDEKIDRQMDRWMYGQMDGYVDRWIYSIVGWMDGYILG